MGFHSRPIRLGVVFDDEVLAGGGFQQSLNAAEIVNDLPKQLAEVIYFTSIKSNVPVLAEIGISAEFMQYSRVSMLITSFRGFLHKYNMHRILRLLLPYGPFERHFIKHGIDLIYFLSPRGKSNELERINYMMTVWDLGHRDHPEFPEVRWYKQFEKRENKLFESLTRATAVLVDSEQGRINTIRRYQVDSHRVHVLPFQAARSTRISTEQSATSDVKAGYGLETDYIFYPAQFWPHKNHVYLLDGLKILEDEYGIKLGAIFCGGDKGNLEYIKLYVKKLNLEDRVRFAGFVTDDILRRLYIESIALVMPTYFGPTNLPPLEAFELGVPVIYPDLDGLRDQVQDAALLMDLGDPGTLAKHLFDLIHVNRLREDLIEKGKSRIAVINEQKRTSVLESILMDFSRRRRTWE